MHPPRTVRVLAILLLALAFTGHACAAPETAQLPSATTGVSPAPTGTPQPTATPWDTPVPLPSPSSDDLTPWELLVPAYEYEDGTTIIDGPVFIDGLAFDLNGSDVIELCISRGYVCVEYEDIIPVRLVQIDAPEPGIDCYGEVAELILSSMILEGMPLSISTDPNLPEEDVDGILQAWVWNSEFLVNLAMVKQGAAAPYLPNGVRGAFDRRLLNAARKAKAAGRGLWGECPGTQLNTSKPLNTGRP